MLTDIEIGWIAGILDGEGCILGGISNKGRYSNIGSFYIEVRVEVTSLSMIGKLSKLYDQAGIGYTVKNCVRTPKSTKQAYGIYVRRQSEVVKLLTLIIVALTTKAPEAQFAIEWYQRWPDQRGGGKKRATDSEKVAAFNTLRLLKWTA